MNEKVNLSPTSRQIAFAGRAAKMTMAYYPSPVVKGRELLRMRSESGIIYRPV